MRPFELAPYNWYDVGLKATSTVLERQPRSSWVPRVQTLDGFVEDVAVVGGVSLHALEPLTTLLVRTHNSHYRIVTSGGTAAIVQGGQFFHDATRARIDGSGFGGSLLKVGWIGVGLRMEIFANDQRIVTSPVRDISVEQPASATAH